MEEINLSLGDRFVLVVLIVLYSFNFFIHAYFLAIVVGIFSDDKLVFGYAVFLVYVLLYVLLILMLNALKKIKGVIFENYMFLLPLHFFIALWLKEDLLILLGILSVFGIVISLLSIRLLYKGLKYGKYFEEY